MNFFTSRAFRGGSAGHHGLPVRGDRTAPTLGKLPGRPGYSLLEVLIAIVVMAILASVVLPRVGRSAPAKLQAAATMLVRDLQYAQTAALSGSKQIHVEFEVGNRYRVVDPSGGGLGVPLVLDYPMGDYPAHDNKYIVDFDDPGPQVGVVVASVSFGGSQILQFGKYGEPISGGEILLRCENYQVRVTVAPITGRILIGELEVVE